MAQAYALLLLLVGVACAVHFLFFFKGKRIEPTRAVPAWGLSIPDFLVGFLGVILAILFALTLAAALAPQSWLIEGSPTHILFSGFTAHLAALAALFAFYKRKPHKFPAPIGSRNPGWGGSFIIALYAFLAVVPLIYPLTYGWQLLLETLGVDVPPQDTVVIFSRIDQAPVLILMVILTIVLAPLSEEVLFRGCLYRFLKAKAPLGFALVASGVLFALLHHNLLSFLPLLFLGIALAYAYEKSGTIKVPILMHGIFNFNTVIIIVLTEFLA